MPIRTPRRGQLPVVFWYVRGRLLSQAGWGSWVETLVAVLDSDEERLAATCDVLSAHRGEQAAGAQRVSGLRHAYCRIDPVERRRREHDVEWFVGQGQSSKAAVTTSTESNRARFRRATVAISGPNSTATIR